jgi:hypothetical protein
MTSLRREANEKAKLQHIHTSDRMDLRQDGARSRGALMPITDQPPSVHERDHA